MPHPETAYRTQKALLWPASGFDAYGQPKVGEPVELLVRWNAKRREATDPQGNSIMLDATVVVDREVAVGGTMWLAADQSPGSGTALSQWYGTGSGDVDDEVMRVAIYSETPDLKGRVARRTVGLQRFRDTLPERA